jgi:hypothetical protein
MNADGTTERDVRGEGERECPACGGAGGGPFGRAGSGWDVETYECPRCEGWGYLRAGAANAANDEALDVKPRPGIAKTTPRPAGEREEKKRRTGA